MSSLPIFLKLSHFEALLLLVPEELEDVSDMKKYYETHSETSITTEGKTDQATMTHLLEAEQEKIAEQVTGFKKVKSKLGAEIDTWDDISNDVIVLAKKMCMIMMGMTDFTREKTVSDNLCPKPVVQ